MCRNSRNCNSEKEKEMRRMKRITALLCAAVMLVNVCACGNGGAGQNGELPVYEGSGAPVKTENDIAECFTIYEYEDGGSLIETSSGDRLLVLPEGASAGNAGDNTTVITLSPERVYMAASAVMCFYDALEKTGDIRFSSLEADDWYIDSAREAMERGDMIYAGKYREPDYETLLSGGCDLSVQSTMTEHVPEVREKLEELGIPVFVDRSSYEPHPLGRCEWIKVYAHICGCPELGDKLYAEQKKHFDELSGNDGENTERKTAVFFYISSAGRIVTRKSGDYITKMIELAGGDNVFDFPGDDNASSSVTIEPEQFYTAAKDADVIIYNCTIAGEISTLDELIAKNSLLADFKAVRDGNVWATDRSLYQEIMKTGEILTDFSTVFTGSGLEPEYLYRLE